MKLKMAKFKFGTKFLKGKKILIIDGVFRLKDDLHYSFQKTTTTLSESELKKLTMIQ